MNPKTKGIICGIIAAITYGTNPLGALNLYDDGINPTSVLFYRYGLSVIVLAAMLAVQKQSLRVSRSQLGVCLLLGVIFAVSSLTLFFSFQYMDAGIACTILFVYPVMVAVIMAVFFKEKVNIVTVLSIALALAGIALLYEGDGGATLSTTGVLLVLLSSLTYAIYIVAVNRSSVRNLSAMVLTFYVMVFGTLIILASSFLGPGNQIQMLSTPGQWGWAAMLAVFPTVLSLVLMAVAVKEIGSTPTAIMGALEPVTAVAIGVAVFGEAFSLRLGVGIVMILAGVMLIIMGKSFSPAKILRSRHRVK